MVEKISKKNRWNSLLENAALPVDYAKTSTTDALAVKPRTSRNLHASFSNVPNKKMSDIVKSVWSFHAV